MPPLLLGQAVIVRDGGRIVGLGTYAMLTKEMERRFRGGEDCLSPNDFNSGDRVWVADIIAPFGHVRMVASSMRDMLRARGHERASISFKRLKQGRKPRFSEVTI
jgi:cytolysin-activating lysine-acyltransferase